MANAHPKNGRDAGAKPHRSRRNSYKSPDQRTREYRLLAEFRASLAARVGGNPTAAQGEDIETAARLKLRLAVLDRVLMETGRQTEGEAEAAVRLGNSLERILRRLKPVTQKQVGITQMFRQPT